jgi:HSP20 family protein
MDREWTIVVALPGADADTVSIDLVSSGIEIGAFAAAPALPYRASIERLEVPYGRMRRRINLPAGQYAMIERRVHNGCLYLRLTEVR